MALVKIVEAACKEEMDRLARVIQGELKSACPKRTGQAAASIHIIPMGATRCRIGGTNDHLFFADQGNNQRVSTILPVTARALRFSDGSYHSSASTYAGKHFVAKVANRHR